MEQILGVEEARKRLGDLVSGVSQGASNPITITRRGREFAVLVSREDFALLEATKAASARHDFQVKLDKVQMMATEKGLDLTSLQSLIDELDG